MLQFCTTIRHWLIAFVLGAFAFQALAASASELCRFQCQKDWKANAAAKAGNPGSSQGNSVDSTEQWSLFSTPCPDLLMHADSASAASDACTGCGMCALNTVFTLPHVNLQMDIKHPSRPLVEHAQAQIWLNEGLFKPPRS